MKNLKKWLKFLFTSISTYLMIESIIGIAILVNLNLNAELGMYEKLRPLWGVFMFFASGSSAQMSSDIRKFRKQNKEKRQAEEA